ncbi:hypothetical protein JOD63_003454 [Microbacterium terrae]|uniref:Sorbitol dehydrogenase n=1 Tax=Microbacterium terrae TaxID=69369 RepID=A0A0M2HD13_9MICO|nr:SDR family NAD(P)-dependent oxidoreductase [Microbacterium terrae]KJL44511.1 Sorbitol dehydrogenase [Microbacterium terrae]MBP1079486.1 hypothetical protein [Microbacterium terrae]GLJ96826.1 hypothetical protein GCM10017594_00230 [Microbacterium terrae]
MTDQMTPIDAESTIGEWMRHPVGARIIAGIATQGGISDSALRLARNVPLSRFLGAGGPPPEGMIDNLVAQANGGAAPERVAHTSWTEVVAAGRFDGQTIIVTGAASGIGRAVASRIAREGGRVVAVDLSEERLAEFAASVPEADIVLVAGDITAAESIDRIIAAAGPHIDGLANVAGLFG